MPSNRSSVPADFYVKFPQNMTALKKSHEAFMKSVESAHSLIDSQMEENVLKINHQKQELENLEVSRKRRFQEIEEDTQRQRKARKIDLDQDIKAYGYQKALKILEERNEVPIEKDVLAQLRNDLSQARAETAAAVDKTAKQEREKAHKNMAHFEKTTRLEHEAALAQVKAQLEQKDQQIKVLDKTILDLKDELTSTRQLVKDVAQSQRAAPVHHHVPK